MVDRGMTASMLLM